MTKYLIVLMGLLANSPSSYAECPWHYSEEQCAKYNSNEREMWDAAAERRKKVEQESYMPEPVIVNGPGGPKTYYPNSEGTFWQTYDR